MLLFLLQPAIAAPPSYNLPSADRSDPGWTLSAGPGRDPRSGSSRDPSGPRWGGCSWGEQRSPAAREREASVTSPGAVLSTEDKEDTVIVAAGGHLRARSEMTASGYDDSVLFVFRREDGSGGGD